MNWVPLKSMRTRSLVSLVFLVLGCSKPLAPSGEAAGATAAPAASAPAPSVTANSEHAAGPHHPASKQTGKPAAVPPTGSAAVITMPGEFTAHEGVNAGAFGLPKVDFGQPGPLVVKGYPALLPLGMADYPTRVGYTKDGSRVAACGDMSPVGDNATREFDTCFVNATGTTERLMYVAGMADRGTTDAKTFQTLTKELKEGPSFVLPRVNSAEFGGLMPPALTGDWPFAADISLEAQTMSGIEPTDTKGSSSILRLGGHLSGETAVFPIGLTHLEAPSMTNNATWSAMVVNPARTELAVMGHFHCMEWCDTVAIVRMSFGRLASQIYNDTGFRHHTKSEFQKSRELFLKATWADPTAALPPYNLACAYVREGDKQNAEKALKLALGLAPDAAKVKARSLKDADFASVKNEPWFAALVK